MDMEASKLGLYTRVHWTSSTKYPNSSWPLSGRRAEVLHGRFWTIKSVWIAQLLRNSWRACTPSTSSSPPDNIEQHEGWHARMGHAIRKVIPLELIFTERTALLGGKHQLVVSSRTCKAQ